MANVVQLKLRESIREKTSRKMNQRPEFVPVYASGITQVVDFDYDNFNMYILLPLKSRYGSLSLLFVWSQEGVLVRFEGKPEVLIFKENKLLIKSCKNRIEVTRGYMEK